MTPEERAKSAEIDKQNAAKAAARTKALAASAHAEPNGEVRTAGLMGRRREKEEPELRLRLIGLTPMKAYLRATSVSSPEGQRCFASSILVTG